MMKFLKRYVCVVPIGAAAVHLPRRFKPCWQLLGLVWFLTFTPAVADDIETVPGTDRDVLLQCARTESDAERLSCFDTAANEARSSSNGTQLHDEVTADPIEPGTAGEPGTADPRAELGQEQLETVAQKTSKTKNEKMSATVIDLNRNPFGLYSFHLDNGQVWQQTEIERFVPPDDDFLVEIRRGAFSGYRLRIHNQNKILRVKRLQ